MVNSIDLQAVLNINTAPEYAMKYPLIIGIVAANEQIAKSVSVEILTGVVFGVIIHQPGDLEPCRLAESVSSVYPAHNILSHCSMECRYHLMPVITT